MISEYDIKKAVVDTLRRNFEYPVYEFGLVEGMKFPCLFARVWGKRRNRDKEHISSGLYSGNCDDAWEK